MCPSKQTHLSSRTEPPPDSHSHSQWQPSAGRPQAETTPKLGYRNPEQVNVRSGDTPRRADWVVFTGRYPYVFDAARLGFAIGHREDSSYQWTPDEVTLPVQFLDNNYRDADLERFVGRVLDYNPDIAVLGDLSRDELDAHINAAERIWTCSPETELILVPKDTAQGEELLSAIPSEFILGYPIGSSEIQATDIAPPQVWQQAGNRIHVLGSTRLNALDAIRELTQYRVTGESPAHIAGLDYNGYMNDAQTWGDYAAVDGGQEDNLRSENVSARKLILFSLVNAREFWIRHGIWPDANAKLTGRQAFQDVLENASDNNSAKTRPVEVIQETPSFDTSETNPFIRTDDTADCVREPLEPLSVLQGATSNDSHTALADDSEIPPPGTRTWSAAGSLPTTAKYDFYAGIQFHADICGGCGANIYRREARRKGDGPPIHVSYVSDSGLVEYLSDQLQGRRDANHYESVPLDGPDTLTDVDDTESIEAVYCCQSCRTRVEREFGANIYRGGDQVTVTKVPLDG
jgi:hypothetical protein